MRGYCGLIAAGAADNELLAAPAAHESGTGGAEIRACGAREWHPLHQRSAAAAHVSGAADRA